MQDLDKKFCVPYCGAKIIFLTFFPKVLNLNYRIKVTWHAKNTIIAMQS